VRLPAGGQGMQNLKDYFHAMHFALGSVTINMKEEKEEQLEEAKELFKEGLKKIFQATKKISKDVVEGFREGYAKDVTKKEDPHK
jgi:hypothetical protein